MTGKLHSESTKDWLSFLREQVDFYEKHVKRLQELLDNHIEKPGHEEPCGTCDMFIQQIVENDNIAIEYIEDYNKARRGFMAKRVEWIIADIEKLSVDDRRKIDDFLVGKIAEDADKMKHQYDLVIASEFIDEAEELRKNWGQMQGLSSGLPSLDKLTKGFVGGELTIIGGATSNGKTSLAVNIAARVAGAGNRVLFITLEMTRPQLTSRLLYVDDKFIDHSALVAYQKSEEFNWKSVDGLIGNAIKELGVSLVIVDHLHHFTRELDNVSEDLGRITKEFQKNAHIHNVPIIVISHTRKGAGNDINELRGSSYIAQDADIVLMVNRDEAHPTGITVKLEKNRNRGVDFLDKEILLRFDKTRISEMSDEPFST